MSVLASYGWMDAARQIARPFAAGVIEEARSDQENLVIDTRLRMGRRYEAKPFDLIAMVDFGMPVVHQYGYVEEGPSAYNLRIRPRTNVLFDVHPQVQIGVHRQVAGANIRALAKVGRRFAFRDLVGRTSLAGGLDSDFQASAVFSRDKEQMTYGLGVIMDLGSRFEARFSYDLADGKEDQSERFNAKFAWKF